MRRFRFSSEDDETSSSGGVSVPKYTRMDQGVGVAQEGAVTDKERYARYDGSQTFYWMVS